MGPGGKLEKVSGPVVKTSCSPLVVSGWGGRGDNAPRLGGQRSPVRIPRAHTSQLRLSWYLPFCKVGISAAITCFWCQACPAINLIYWAVGGRCEMCVGPHTVRRGGPVLGLALQWAAAAQSCLIEFPAGHMVTHVKGWDGLNDCIVSIHTRL